MPILQKFRLTALIAALLLVATPALADKTSDAPATNLAPQAALQALKDGNTRFVTGKPGHCKSDSKRRESLASTQAPNAIILSCADSRVPPEKIFDQDLGELFTVRVAGNVLNEETIASIEYAIEHLGSRLIVVMGHESCGAVKAAITTPKGGDAGSPALNVLVADIQANLAGRSFDPAADATLKAPVIQNVNAVATALLKKSKIIKTAVDSGRVEISRGIYSLNSGKVDLWE